MSESNGVIRIGRKGTKKFAFGEDGEPFEVDVVNAFQDWINTDQSLRDEGGRIKPEDMVNFHRAAVEFAERTSGRSGITTAEALDFTARLREQYDELADFFQPKPRQEKPGSRATTEPAVQFSAEGS